jgi:hypothetical protein
MSVLNRVLAGAVVGAAVAAVTACSSTVGGHGTGAERSVTPDPVTVSTPAATPTAPSHVGRHDAGRHGGSDGHPSSSATTTTSAMSSAPSTDSAPPLPQIDSFDESVVSSDCSTSGGTTTGTVSVRLTWTSSHATSAWIGSSPVAFAFDPKSAGGSTGPLPANGSLSVSFACDNDYYYYDLGVYNATGNTLEVEQVKNPS